jgi:hypothetical protein
MVTFDVEVEIPMDAEAYLREKDSQAYKDFHLRKMGTLEQEYLSHEVVDGHVVTVTRTVPSITIPWALRRAILGNKQAEFIDRRRWIEGAHLTAPFTQFFHTTNNITDRCVVEGTITVEPAGAPGACRVRAQGECVVTLKGLGPKVESLIVANLKGSYDKLPEVMDEWMRVKRLGDAAVSSSASGLSPATPRRARRRGGAFGSFVDVESAADSVAFDDEDEDVDAKSPATKRAGGGRSSFQSSSFQSWSFQSWFPPRSGAAFASSFSPGRGRSLLRPGGRVARRRRRRPRATILGFRRSTIVFFALCVASATMAYAAFLAFFSGVPSPSRGDASAVELASLREKHRASAVAAELDVLEKAAEATRDIEASRKETIARARERAKRVSAASSLVVGTATATANVASGSTSACVDARRDDCEAWACSGECEANPGYMLETCGCACAAAARWRLDAAQTPRTTTDPTRGVALTASWTAPDGSPREGRVRIRLNADDAPVAVEAVRAAVRAGTCAPGGACGAACHLHRSESAYGLVQGYMSGLGAAGGAFGTRTEGKATWRRGTAGYIPGGDNLLIATKDHPEWDASFTALGTVPAEDMRVVDEWAALPTEPFTHPEFKTVMAMLTRKVRYTLDGAEDV